MIILVIAVIHLPAAHLIQTMRIRSTNVLEIERVNFASNFMDAIVEIQLSGDRLRFTITQQQIQRMQMPELGSGTADTNLLFAENSAIDEYVEPSNWTN